MSARARYRPWFRDDRREAYNRAFYLGPEFETFDRKQPKAIFKRGPALLALKFNDGETYFRLLPGIPPISRGTS